MDPIRPGDVLLYGSRPINHAPPTHRVAENPTLRLVRYEWMTASDRADDGTARPGCRPSVHFFYIEDCWPRVIVVYTPPRPSVEKYTHRTTARATARTRGADEGVGRAATDRPIDRCGARGGARGG